MNFFKRKKTSPSKNIWKIIANVRSDVGCVREVNEDSALHFTPRDPKLLCRKGTLTIVADGMGGHAAGEVASRMAIEIISDFYYKNSNLKPFAALKSAIIEANRQIYQIANRNENLSGMGTTCTILVLQNKKAIAAHVGDSRLYLMRGSTFQLLTEDHSQVAEMQRRGIISDKEARNHIDKNVIFRAVGTSPNIDISMFKPFSIEPKDKFLLCSDGVSDLLEDSEIQQTLISSDNDYKACENLINNAKKKGGEDNITVAIVSITPKKNIGINKKVRVTREVKMH